MKNKIILLIFFSYFFLFNFSYSKVIKFESPEIKVLDDGNKIIAKNGVILETDDNISIKANRGTYDKKKNILNFYGNVLIDDDKNNIVSTSNEIIYFKNENKIKIIGESNTKIYDKYSIKSNNLIYDRNTLEVYTEDEIFLKDDLGSEVNGKNVNYKIKDNIFKGNNLKIKDNQNNNFFLKKGIVNLNSNEIVGKDIELNFQKSLFDNEENDPRLRAKSLKASENQTNLYKGVFTTCKKNEDDSCPAWAIYADEVEHLKEKQIINYKNAWLKIYDVPVIYFPKFYHPDPTVKRQSGFLYPTYQNSNIYGQSIQIPYFKVISDNKDLTVSPRLYLDNNIFLQTEYRQANKKSNVISDFSYNKNNSTKGHFFSNYLKNLKDNSEIELNIETVSNDNYLKLNDIKSPLIDNKSKLHSFLNYKKDKDTFYFSTSVEVYEDLTKFETDRYEYIYPQYNLYKEFDNTNTFGNFLFTSDGFQKNYETNISESVIVNDFLFDSFKQNLGNGFTNEYKILLRNVNSDSTKSSNYKDKKDTKLLSTFLVDTKYPLLKKDNRYDNFFIPTLSFRYSPNKTKNSKSKKTKVTFNNIFSIDRSGQSDLVEEGQSITLGFDYEKIDRESNKTFLNLGAATVFRDKKNFDLPEQTSLGQKTSDIIGMLKINPSEYFNFDYKFAMDNNLDQLNFNSVSAQIGANNLITSFEFLEENKHIGDNSYIKNKTNYNIDENTSFGFEASRDLKKDITEYYKLIYEYQNDCLTASIEYDKEYYSDGDLKPKENIFFMIKIKSFGEVANIPVAN